jgi:iron complex outermembrane recepter protein
VHNDYSSSGDSAENYLATLSYTPISSLTVFARAASAYRPGGSQAINDQEIAAGLKPTYDPDRLWNYEVGVKGSGWDQRITYSADAFHMAWTDIQLQLLVNGFSGIANAASAKSDGAEASIQVVPIDGLTVNVKGAYTEAKITSDVPSVEYVSGDALPYSPKITAASLIDYRMPVVDGLTPRAGLTYAYHGSIETLFSSGVRYNLPSYSTLDIRGGVDWLKYTLIARVDNVTNKYALTDAGTATSPDSPATGIVLKPKTFGLSLEARF